MRRLVLALLLLPTRALAGDASDVALARELATEGVLLADSGKCDLAIEKLARAEKLHHAPTILGRLGECQVQVGKLVDGTENLQKVVLEPLGPNPPAPFVAAQSRAQKVLNEARPKIAKLTIFLDPDVANATVTLDGAQISSASIGTPRPTDPGVHSVEAHAAGYRAASGVITLSPSQIASITLKLEKEPEPVKSADPPPPPPATKRAPPPLPPPPESNNTAAYVTLGVGAVGLVAGATFGILAIERKAALDRECIDKRCQPTAQDTLDGAQRWAALSSIGFAVGAAGVAVGTVLLITAPNTKRGAYVAPAIGLGTLGLRGEF